MNVETFGNSFDFEWRRMDGWMDGSTKVSAVQ